MSVSKEEFLDSSSFRQLNFPLSSCCVEFECLVSCCFAFFLFPWLPITTFDFKSHYRNIWTISQNISHFFSFDWFDRFELFFFFDLLFLKTQTLSFRLSLAHLISISLSLRFLFTDHFRSLSLFLLFSPACDDRWLSETCTFLPQRRWGGGNHVHTFYFLFPGGKLGDVTLSRTEQGDKRGVRDTRKRTRQNLTALTAVDSLFRRHT